MKPWLPMFLAGAAVTGACLLPAPAARAQGTDPLVEKGRTCLAKGDWTGARDAFLAAVKKDPKNVEARRGAAESLLGLGRSDEAVDHAIAGLDLVEDRDAGLWLLAARGFLQKGEGLPPDRQTEINDALADAKAKAGEALKRDPSLSLARVVLAKACRMSNDSARALSVLEEGLAKAPGDFDLLFEMGMVRIKTTDYDGALKACTLAAGADPKSGEAEFQRAFVLAFLKRWDESYAALVKAAVLDPSSKKPLKYLANWAKNKSIPFYREILKAKPDHAWAHAYLAYYLAYAKDEAGALSEMKAAIALAPEDADLLAWNGQVQDALGRKQEALAWYRKALQKSPQCTLAWNSLSDYAVNPGSGAKMDDRKDVIDFLGKVRPDDAIFWNNVGLLYRDVGKDFRRALDAYLKASALAPADQGIQNDTGLIYLYHGPSIGVDPAGGLPYFQRCRALVEEEGQPAEMGYRDTLENLCLYYMTVDKNPEMALECAKKRNDPEFLHSLPKGLGTPSPRADQARAWAEQQLKK
jgi:tetratricopeptide (TPR) repeat protein